MSNDPDAHVDDPEPEKCDVDCDIHELQALIRHSLKLAAEYVDTPWSRRGFDEDGFRKRIERAEEIASMLADATRPQPTAFQRGLMDDDIPF